MAKKFFISFVLLMVLLLNSIFTVSAKTVSGVPYSGYEYNDFNESTAAPIGYTIEAFYNFENSGLKTPLSEPQDMVQWNNDIFILDSGNSRIIQFDKSLNLKKVFDKFYTSSGEAINFTNAQGMAIDSNGKFYIADTENVRVLIAEQSGLVTNIILRPDKALEGYDLPFRVTKVNVSDVGDIYVVADSINLGIFVFNSQGEFQKFFASNPIYKTADVIQAYLLKPFLSQEQLAARMKSTPLRVVNFCLDDIGYAYTVSQNNSDVSQKGMVRCLNYKGTDIMAADVVFGDLEVKTDQWLVTNFISVDVDDDGFIYLLDASRSRVFQYSKEGYLLSVFGGYGDFSGTFIKPVDLLSVDEKVYVLDSGKGGMHVFTPSEYVNSFKGALNALNNRDLDKSMKLWKKVQQYNTNSIYSYYGLGMIYDTKGEYKLAMDNFKLAGAQAAYSQSFREYRKVWLETNYFWILAFILVIIAIGFVAVRVIKKKMVTADGSAYSPLENKWTFPLYTLFRPVDGFEQFKFRKNIPSFSLSILIVLVWFGVESIKYFLTGFAFSHVRPQDFNPIAVLVSTVCLYFVFTIANWSLCTIMSGCGTFKEICSMTAYSLIPYLFSQLINLGLSNVLTSQEASFLSLITALGLIWSAFMLIGGLYAIHQYSFGKTLVSLVITVLGMAIIVLLCVLFYTLLNQSFSFLSSIFQELSLR